MKGPNTPGWVGGLGLLPALGGLGLALLTLSILWAGRRALATRQESLATH